jgi:hypothetical protein
MGMAAGAHALPSLWPGYLVAVCVSCLVGLGDILSRYKDNPFVALATRAAMFYLCANAMFGALAFWLAVALDIVTVEGLAPWPAHSGTQIIKDGLIVGFAAILILRSVAFKLSVGGQTADVGPSTIIDAMLASFDQSINRSVALGKDRRVRDMMAGVSFEKAKRFIPEYCLSLLEQDEARAQRIGILVNSISEFRRDDPAADAERAFLLGVTLINVFGPKVAAEVVKGFRSQIAAPG